VSTQIFCSKETKSRIEDSERETRIGRRRERDGHLRDVDQNQRTPNAGHSIHHRSMVSRTGITTRSCVPFLVAESERHHRRSSKKIPCFTRTPHTPCFASDLQCLGTEPAMDTAVCELRLMPMLLSIGIQRPAVFQAPE
jgi:hypothetical protein